MLFAGISDAFFLLLESHGFNRGRMSITGKIITAGESDDK